MKVLSQGNWTNTTAHSNVTLTSAQPPTTQMTTTDSTDDGTSVMATEYTSDYSVTEEYISTQIVTEDSTLFSSTGELTTETLSSEEPTTVPPTTEGPTTASPTTEGPTTASPTTESPTTVFDTTEGPTTATPTTEGPTTASPTTEGPTTASPTTESPTTASPTTEGPTTASPTTVGPTTASPTTEGPTTASPTTEGPTTASPTTEGPTTASPTTVGPTTAFDTTEGPTTASPTTEGPTTAFDTTEGPTTAFDTTEGPTTASRTTESPTTAFDTTVGPTTSFDTTEGPTTASPTTEGPTTAFDTTEGPTTASPTTEGPTTASPTTVRPTTASPTTVRPTTASPTTEGPTTAFDTTVGPTTASPTTEGPTTASPTTEGPTTAFDTTEGPTTAFDTTEGPTTASPTTVRPTTASPTTEGPTTASPTTEGPTTASPTTESPTTAFDTTEGPTTAFDTTEGPTTASPTTEGPTTAFDTTEGPTTATPTTEGPTTASPTTEGPTTATPTTEVDLCASSPCENNGTCISSSTSYKCTCTSGFGGEKCKKLTVEREALSIDASAPDSFEKTENVLQGLKTDIDSATSIDVLNRTSNVISVIVGKAAEANWTGTQLQKAGQDVLNSSNALLSSLRVHADASVLPGNDFADTENPQLRPQKEAVLEKVAQNVVDLGSVVLKDKEMGSVDFHTDTVNVSYKKATAEDLTKENENNEIELPGSLVDIVGNSELVLTDMKLEKHLYDHSREQISVTGPVVRVALAKNDGSLVPHVDPDGPITMFIDAESSKSFDQMELHQEGSTLTAVQRVAIHGQGSVILVEFEVPPDMQVQLRGRFGELPRTYERHFEVIAGEKVDVVLKHDHVSFQLYNGELFMFLKDPTALPSAAYLVLQYSNRGNSRQRRSASMPQMRSRSLTPKVWNSQKIDWEDNSNILVTGLDKTGKVKFTSNFFGTFALNEVLIAPTPIDFHRLFLNIETYIRDSPYVLAVNCFLVAMTIIVAILLRRIDKTDKEMWRYLHLLDNANANTYCYTLSVHTSLRSSRHLTSTPYFILHGKDGKTNSRILSDGKRKNFVPGTVSNFYMTTERSLGALTRLKVWHDDKGSSSNWHIDRIVVIDVQTKDRYIFICHKWLGLDKDDGRLYRTFEAFSPDGQEIAMFDIVSKQKLFDDHLWLSVIKRPMFSRFTRVQRFLCAVAMLYLGMVTNAMWFQDYDSSTQKTRGIEIGPVKLNYRQVYVGVVSAVIIVLPGFLMTWAFRRRNLKGEVVEESLNRKGRRCRCMGYITGELILPWWFIFVGYAIVVLSIGASAFFTFLYSLEWGGATSTNWLMSLVFCTTGSTILIEPIKILILSVALSSVFRRTAQEDMGTVAPVKKVNARGIMSIVPMSLHSEVPEPPDENSEEIKKRREELVLKHRLFLVSKSLGAKLAFVVVLTIICLHNNVKESYLLNTLIKTYGNQTFLSKSVNKSSEVWGWFDHSFIPALIPKRQLNGNLMSVYDQRFTVDGVNYRLGAITLRQYRVRGPCHNQAITRWYSAPLRCMPGYDSQSAETGIFREQWQRCNATDSCTEKPFLFTKSTGGTGIIIEGTFGYYGDGSYIESWNKDQRYASSRRIFVEREKWLDSQSRALIVEASFYNPNVRLFTRLQVMFEFPTLGGVSFNVDVKTARLYPYVNVWDYLILLLQVVFAVIVVIRLCKFCHSTCCTGERVFSLSTCVFVLEMLLSLCAVIVYGVKIDRTIFVVEEIHNNPENYVSFDLVHLLDEIYRCSLGMVLFIRILYLLQPLSLNYNLFLMRATLLASRAELFGFSFILSVVVTAYASFFYLLEGPITFDIRTLYHCYLALVESLLGLVRSRQLLFSESGIEVYLKQTMFICFFFTATMILMNIGASILNLDMSSIKGHKDFTVGPKFDRNLNEFLWKTVEELFRKCSPRVQRGFTTDSVYPLSKEGDEDGASMGVNTFEITSKLDKLMMTITNSNNADILLARSIANNALLELNTAQSRIRQTEEEVFIVKQELSHLQDTVRRLTSEEEKAPVPEKAEVTLSVDDTTGRAYVMFKISSTSPTTAEDVELSDVTSMETGALIMGMRTLYGKVYKCQSSLGLQKQPVNLQFRIAKPPHPYEDAIIAVRSEHSKKWKFLTTCSGSQHSVFQGSESVGEGHVVACLSDNLPDYIACVSEPKAFVQSVTPSGGEFSLPFEPRSRFFYEKGCVKSNSDVTIKLIPRHPVPIVQVMPEGNLLCPVKVEIPFLSDTYENSPESEWMVLSSTSDNNWWKAPTQIAVERSMVIFQAYVGPAGIRISFCPKVSELQWIKHVPGSKPAGLIDHGFLVGLSQLVDKDWTALASSLGFSYAQITKITSTQEVKTQSEVCCQMLSMWYKQIPIAADKVRESLNHFPQAHTLKQAVKTLGRKDISDWFEAQETLYKTAMADSARGIKMVKAFNTAVRHEDLCSGWRRLAAVLALPKEEIIQIDCGTARTTSEKAFVMLMKWFDLNPGSNLKTLQEKLAQAGFPLVAKKVQSTR
ncbi:polycystin-1-like protein 3 [Haliotis asinina]|uniref:polycystin-1-like protein 3 n=1 Tax=Haliotis asinina TaxID=109174 RepID=UPI0035323AA0